MKQALLIVDVQNYFINKWTQMIPSKIKTYLEINKPALIYFSQFINQPDSHFVKELNYTGCSKPPYINIVKELEPWVKPDNVFPKCAYSVFSNPDFEKALKKNKIEELIICGLDTDFCVLADAFNAFDKGYKVKVIENCCASSSSGQEGHKNAIKIIDGNLAKIIN